MRKFKDHDTSLGQRKTVCSRPSTLIGSQTRHAEYVGILSKSSSSSLRRHLNHRRRIRLCSYERRSLGPSQVGSSRIKPPSDGTKKDNEQYESLRSARKYFHKKITELGSFRHTYTHLASPSANAKLAPLITNFRGPDRNRHRALATCSKKYALRCCHAAPLRRYTRYVMIYYLALQLQVRCAIFLFPWQSIGRYIAPWPHNFCARVPLIDFERSCNSRSKK